MLGRFLVTVLVIWLAVAAGAAWYVNATRM